MPLLYKLIKIAHRYPETRAHLIPLFRTVLASGKSFQNFLDAKYEGGLAMVPNPNRDNRDDPRVQLRHALKDIPTLHKYQALYEVWSGTQAEAKTSTLPKGTPPKNWSYKEQVDTKSDAIMGSLRKALKKPDLENKDLVNLTGLPFAKLKETPTVTFNAYAEGVPEISVHYEGYETVEIMHRYFGIDDRQRPYIINDVFKTNERGIGARIFANQVAEASRMGFEYISCFASQQPPKYVGGKVWPKMGYDGKVPTKRKDRTELITPKEIEDKMMAKGAKKPYAFHDLMSIKGGPEWWEENAVSFQGTFDLTEGSYSMKMLQNYVEKKAKLAGVSAEEWMSGNEGPSDKSQ